MRESLDFARRCGLDELDELEGLGLAGGVAVDLAGELNERVVETHAESDDVAVKVGRRCAVDVELDAVGIYLLVQVAEVTDGDVAHCLLVVTFAHEVLGSHTVGVDGVVNERADVIAVAYALAILHDGSVAVGGAGDELRELQVNLSGLVHDELRVALKSQVVHLGNLLGEVLADVIVERELFDVHLCER